MKNKKIKIKKIPIYALSLIEKFINLLVVKAECNKFNFDEKIHFYEDSIHKAYDSIKIYDEQLNEIQYLSDNNCICTQFIDGEFNNNFGIRVYFNLKSGETSEVAAAFSIHGEEKVLFLRCGNFV